MILQRYVTATLIATDGRGCVNRYMLVEGAAEEGDVIDCSVAGCGAHHNVIEAVAVEGDRPSRQAVNRRPRERADAR